MTRARVGQRWALRRRAKYTAPAPITSSAAPPPAKAVSCVPLVPVKARPVGVAETGLTDGVPTGSPVASAEAVGAGEDGLATATAEAGAELVGCTVAEALGLVLGPAGAEALGEAGCEALGVPVPGAEALGDGTPAEGLGEVGADGEGDGTPGTLAPADGVGAGTLGDGVGVGAWHALPPFQALIRSPL